VVTPTSSATQTKSVVSASVTKSIMAKAAEGKKKSSLRETDEVNPPSNWSTTERRVADMTVSTGILITTEISNVVKDSTLADMVTIGNFFDHQQSVLKNNFKFEYF
jgi:hypothetical protein